MSFVDDLMGLEGSIAISNESCVDLEVFERKTRMNFKVSKCKVMSNTNKSVEVVMNDEILENVKEHVYLGTVISANGERFVEMNSRLTKSNSVVNEIVQVSNNTELSNVRLRFVKLLMGSCLDSKIKYGCALWNVTKYKTTSVKLNKIKPKLVKRVMQVPASTPSAAILYEFGITDLVFDVLMEKVILAVSTLKCNEKRISKQLLEAMLVKQVPGFCTEFLEACTILEVTLESLLKVEDVRKELKKKVVQLQAAELLKRMVVSSKMAKVIFEGFTFDGNMMKYLYELNFVEARAIFLSRYRMWPTKDNYPGRWNGVECNVCGLRDTDVHVLSCPGYSDIIGEGFELEIFWDKKILDDTEKLSAVAKTVLLLLKRMENIQNIDV